MSAMNSPFYPVLMHGQQFVAMNPPFLIENPIVQQLKLQVEFYFCPENLCRDGFLLSQLRATDHLGAVPIEIICGFPKVRQLHAFALFGQHIPAAMAPFADPNMLRVALAGSSVVTVSGDGMWLTPTQIPDPVRFPDSREREDIAKDTSETVATACTTVPSPPSSPSSLATASSSVGVPTHPLPSKERTTLAVLNLPKSVSREQITEALTYDNIIPKSVELGLGNTWSATFGSEQQAMAVVSASKDKIIDGVTIRVEFKDDRPQLPTLPLPPAYDGPKPVQRSLASMTPCPSAHTIPAPHHPVMPLHMQAAYGYAPYPHTAPIQHQPMHAMQQQYFQQHSAYQARGHSLHHPQDMTRYSAPPPHVYVRPGRNPTRNGQNDRRMNRFGNNQVRNYTNGSPGGGGGVSSKEKQQGKEQNKNRSKKNKKNGKKGTKPIELSSVREFPALRGKKTPKTPPPTLHAAETNSGYAKALLKPVESAKPAMVSPPKREDDLEEAMNHLTMTAGTPGYDEW